MHLHEMLAYAIRPLSLYSGMFRVNPGLMVQRNIFTLVIATHVHTGMDDQKVRADSVLSGIDKGIDIIRAPGLWG